ncbi:hypothetical protein JHK85_008652 [Glycine max]|nr:hypothetical protein JHK85_008652 [Glycine max]
MGGHGLDLKKLGARGSSESVRKWKHSGLHPRHSSQRLTCASMDRRRIYDRQNSSSGTPSSPSSPVNMISPLHRHARAGSTGSAMTNVRRAQNNATKAAAQRLAQVMSHTDDDDEDEDDVPLDYSAIAGGGGIGLGGGRPMPARSPMAVRSVQDAASARSRSPLPAVRSVQEQPSARSRSPASVRMGQEPPQSVRGMPSVRSSASSNALAEQPPPRTPTLTNNAEQQPPSARLTPGNRTLELSPSARTIIITRSPQPSSANNDQPPSARSTSGRPSGLSKVVPMVPPSVPITLRPVSSVGVPPSEPLLDIRKDRRHAAATLRLAEEKCEEAESRVRQLEQQAALRNASKNHGGFQTALQADAETAREETASAFEKLRLMTQRMILTPEEMDTEGQLDLKELSGEGNIENMLFVEQGLRQLASLKAWLAYIWKRAKRHEIEPDIANERFQHWINHNSMTPTSQDAVDVERGLVEIKRLDIETQLWDESRRELEQEIGNSNIPGRSDF